MYIMLLFSKKYSAKISSYVKSEKKLTALHPDSCNKLTIIKLISEPLLKRKCYLTNNSFIKYRIYNFVGEPSQSHASDELKPPLT